MCTKQCGGNYTYQISDDPYDRYKHPSYEFIKIEKTPIGDEFVYAFDNATRQVVKQKVILVDNKE